MKRQLLMVCLFLGLTTAATKSNAADKDPADFRTVISSYITSYVNADYKMLDKILADNASVKIPRAETVLNHSREDVIAQMRKDAGTHQNCEYKYQVLNKSDAMVMAEVDFTYAGFVQHNYLVLEKNDNKEWKITQVCKFFIDSPKPNNMGGNDTAPVTASR